MRRLSFIVLMLLLVGVNLHEVGFAQVTTPMFPDRPALPAPSPDSQQMMIIVLKEGTLESFKEKLSQRYPSIKIRRTYEELFQGVSVEGKQKELEILIKEKEVESSSPVSTYKPHLEESVPLIGSEDVRFQLDRDGNRLTGKGIKVGVIDTGVDYNHPDLSRSVKGGYDLVDNDRDPMETLKSQGEPTTHGTHVAGIIAANGRLKGVAPGAEIYAYRALGPGGTGTSEQVIAAMEQALKDDVDIINLSLGNDVNGPDWPTSLALNRVVEKGVIAVTSSGNSGPNVWTVGSPGTSSKAISVGASTPPVTVPLLKINQLEKEIELTPMMGSKPWTINKKEKLIFAGYGEKAEVKKIDGAVVLLERGRITFTEKAKNAERAGAKAVVVYNNETKGFTGTIQGLFTIPIVSISKEDGEWIRKQLKKGKTTSVTTKYKKEVDTIASFSSRGPVTYTWDIKPDVVAPGVSIHSTVPDGYKAMQGTSMSAPHVAGACALIKQAHPDWNVEQVKAALMNTAKLLTDEEGNPYRTFEQGAGRIQIDEAIHAETLVIPSSLPFGLIHQEVNQATKKISLTVENVTNQSKTYLFERMENQPGITWKLPNMFTVPPKQKRTVTVTLHLNPRLLKGDLYDGVLNLASGSEKIKVPFLFTIEEPNYPRVMSFQYGLGDQEGTVKYELYLPGGAEEFGIVLYNPETYQFVGFLDGRKSIPRGLVEREFTRKEIPYPDGVYKALIYAKNMGQEDTIEADIVIGESID